MLEIHKFKYIRFGIIGTNFISDWVIGSGKNDPRFKVVSILSRTKERGLEFAKKHDIPNIFTDLKEMIESNTIDAVYIASPNSLHFQQAITIMEHGIHVLCEKPLASNAMEVEKMIEASRRNKVALMEAMISTLSPNFRKVVEALPKVGKVRGYFASYCQYSSKYDFYKKGGRPNVFFPEFSGGATLDIGIYTIYPMIYLFGIPKSLKASGNLLPSGVDGQACVCFEYEDMTGSVIYSKVADSELPAEISGEDGVISIDNISVINNANFFPTAHRLPGTRTNPENAHTPLYKEVLTTPAPPSYNYFYEIKEFLDIIEQGKMESDINSHARSLTVAGLLDEIRRQINVVFPAD